MMKLFRNWLWFNWKYLGKPPWDTGISPPELLEFIQQHDSGRALDLGCGTGTNLLTLAKSGWLVTGIDFAPRAVRAAQRKLAQAGFTAEVRAGDVTKPDIARGVYDLVFDIGCYHGLPEAGRSAYRANLSRLLAPGGHLLIYAHWQVAGQTGISAADLDAFQSFLALEQRQDSHDRFGRRATWLCFQNIPPLEG